MTPVEPPKFIQKPPTRHAEGNDTRMVLRHPEDPEYRGKKGGHGPADNPFGDDYDQMILSVEALIDFLMTYQDDISDAGKDGDKDSGPLDAVVPSALPGHHSAANQAIHAYSHAAILQPKPMPAADSASPHAGNTQSQTLIKKLQQLRRQGVEGIKLVKAENFITSLERAIQDQL
jgi:hypothetical protein